MQACICARNTYRRINFPGILHLVNGSFSLCICNTPFSCSNTMCLIKAFICKCNFKRNPDFITHNNHIIHCLELLLSFFTCHARIKGHKNMPRNCNKGSADSYCFKKRAEQNRKVVTVTTLVQKCLIRELQKVYGCCTYVVFKSRRRVYNVINSKLIKCFENSCCILNVNWNLVAEIFTDNTCYIFCKLHCSRVF